MLLGVGSVHEELVTLFTVRVNPLPVHFVLVAVQGNFTREVLVAVSTRVSTWNVGFLRVCSPGM